MKNYLLMLYSLMIFLVTQPIQAEIISNGIPQGTIGHWSVDVLTGGESDSAFVTANRRTSGDIFTENIVYSYATFVDIGDIGNAFRLQGSEPIIDPVNPNTISSNGSFEGENGNTIDWVATSSIVAESSKMTTRFSFSSRDAGAIGRLRFFQYLDEDVESPSDDVFFTLGSAINNNLELFTVDNKEVYGISHSGAFQNNSQGLSNANFVGWAADIYDNIEPRLEGEGQIVSVGGEIQNLTSFIHTDPNLPRIVYGPEDIVSVMAWDNNPNANTSIITTSLGGVPDLISIFRPSVIDPPAPRSMFGDIDPTKPTIVLTHGLQDTVGNGETFDPEILWSGFHDGSGDNSQIGAGFILERLQGNGTLDPDINIIQFVWPEATTRSFAGFGYNAALAYTDDAGTALARFLLEALGPGYNQRIHFIGHSLGTIVNTYGARLFLNSTPNVPQSQVTILDYPQRVTGSGTNIPQNFFAVMLQNLQQTRNLRIDNYYSLDGLAFGNTTTGPIYDHIEFVEPNDVEDEVGIGTSNSNHSGVNQWYRWTMDPNNFNNKTYCETSGDFNDPSIFFSGSLDPCQKGWHWSLFGPGANEFPTNIGNIVSTETAPLELINARMFGCTVNDGPVVQCIEQSSPFILFEVDIPENTEYITFEYRFLNSGDGDYATVHLNGEPIWVIDGRTSLDGGVFTKSGLIPVSSTSGINDLAIMLNGVEEKNAIFEIRNFQALNTPTIQAGDFDSDGDIDRNDLIIMRNEFGKEITSSNNIFDVNRDGEINVLDYRKVIKLCTRPRCAI